MIFESGFAATSTEWFKVLPAVAPRHRACAYDRAGLGWSDMGPIPRDGEAIASDLDQALRAARIRGPYVLVGHSAGGLYVRLFAKLRPREVVGMVLVDPSVEHQDRRFARFGAGSGSLSPLIERSKRCATAAAKGALPSLDPELWPCGPHPNDSAEARRNDLSVANWRTQEAEAEALWGATSDEIDEDGASLGNMPLVVLTAGKNAGGDSGVLWAELHRELAAHSSRGSAQMVEGSGHMMMFDRPDAIVTAIDEVIAAASRKP